MVDNLINRSITEIDVARAINNVAVAKKIAPETPKHQAAMAELLKIVSGRGGQRILQSLEAKQQIL